MDLGAAWWDWTGLPFVFATWLARDEDAAAEARPALVHAAERGRARLDEIAARESVSMGLDRHEVRRYLREHLVFHYDEREQVGLDRFRELWRKTPGLGIEVATS